MSEVRLLSAPANYAVVQLPGRHFPGVVFQGDSRNILIQTLESVESEADPFERAFALAQIVEDLQAIRSGYEAVLKDAGIALPYSPVR